MNTYLYPWHDDEQCSISSIQARNYNECEEKIMEYYCDKYDISDLLDFEEFKTTLGDEYNIFIGTIFEINEFL